MIIACPKCKQRHDVSQRKSGETFTCTCGNVLAAPKKSGGPTWIIVLAIVAACSVPCLGILAAIAIPNFIKFQERSKQSEAKVNLRAIATAEKAYWAEHGKLIAAGPVPASVPKGLQAEFVADDGFRAMGWLPEGKVRFQYQVRVEGAQGQQGQPSTETAIVTARGDLRGSGDVSEFKLVVPAEGPLGQVEEVFGAEKY
ncbi:MAG TPA: hypothetical protein VGK67_10675 [Myxococcales bacterium]|jgi:type II secretory pathway pseudopilin PulG